MSVLGTKLAVRFGTKQVVTAGLFSFAGFFAWVSTATAGTSYLELAGQMVLGGSGVGLVSAPATEAIMGVVPKAKAGVGSAVNDATRLLGSTLGVTIIGSVYASLYSNRLTNNLPAELAPRDAHTAHDSVGAALELANRTSLNGDPALAHAVHAAASTAFFDGFSAGCLLAAGVSGAAAMVTLLLLPAHPGPAPSAPDAGASVQSTDAWPSARKRHPPPTTQPHKETAMNIQDSTVLVTGANRGIGKAFADALLDRSATKVYAAVRDVATIIDPRLVPIQLDVTDPDRIAAVARELDDVQVVVNNAGVLNVGFPLNASLDVARLALETNYLSLVSMTQAFGPVLERDGGGAFVNVLSVFSWSQRR